MGVFNYMKKKVGNRGLSPVIASVLLILLVLVMATLIFLWARGFISEQIEKFGTPIEKMCEAVSFEVERIGIDLEVINRGEVDIRYFDIKMIKGGDSEIEKFNFQVDAGESVRQEVNLLMEGGEVPDKITVYPALVGNIKGGSSSKVFTCMDAGKTI